MNQALLRRGRENISLNSAVSDMFDEIIGFMLNAAELTKQEDNAAEPEEEYGE